MALAVPIRSIKSALALATEGRIFRIFGEIQPFSAACPGPRDFPDARIQAHCAICETYALAPVIGDCAELTDSGSQWCRGKSANREADALEQPLTAGPNERPGSSLAL